MELSRLIERSLAPLRRKLRLLITRGVVRLVDPAQMMQEIQLAAMGGEVLDKLEHWEAYGYTSRPLPGAEALVVSVGGERDHAVVVNIADRRYRMKNLQGGEVAIYTDEGDVIHFKRGNEILIDTAGTLIANAATSATVTSPDINLVASSKVTVTTPLAEFSGNITAAGDISDGVGSMQSMRDTYNGHTHPENDNGGPTDTPTDSM